jgi:hypothetical protein
MSYIIREYKPNLFNIENHHKDGGTIDRYGNRFDELEYGFTSREGAQKALDLYIHNLTKIR